MWMPVLGCIEERRWTDVVIVLPGIRLCLRESCAWLRRGKACTTAQTLSTAKLCTGPAGIKFNNTRPGTQMLVLGANPAAEEADLPGRVEALWAMRPGLDIAWRPSDVGAAPASDGGSAFG